MGVTALDWKKVHKETESWEESWLPGRGDVGRCTCSESAHKSLEHEVALAADCTRQTASVGLALS